MRLEAVKPYPSQPGALRRQRDSWAQCTAPTSYHSCEKEAVCKARREANLRILAFRIVRKRNQWKFLWNFVRVGRESRLKPQLHTTLHLLKWQLHSKAFLHPALVRRWRNQSLYQYCQKCKTILLLWKTVPQYLKAISASMKRVMLSHVLVWACADIT